MSGYKAVILRKQQEIGALNNIGSGINSYFEYENEYGFNNISVHVAPPSGGTIEFLGTFDGRNWFDCLLRGTSNNGYIKECSYPNDYVGSIAGMRKIKFNVSSAGTTSGTIEGTVQAEVSTLEGVENGPPSDFELNLAEGRIAGHSIVNKAGRNPDVDSADVPEDVWGGNGQYAGFPSGVSEIVTVVSTSADDSFNGPGARTINIVGLDSNYNIQREDINLSGLSAASGTKQFTRVHTALITNSGGSVFNVGQITVAHAYTTSNIFLVMQVGTNQTNASAYTIPAGKEGYIRRINGSIRGGTGNANVVDGSLFIREFNKPPRLRRPFSIHSYEKLKDEIYAGIYLPPKTDIVARISYSSASNLDIQVGYDLILVDI